MKTWVRAAGRQGGNPQAAQAGGHAALTGWQNASVKGGCMLSCIQLFTSPGTVVRQAPLSMGLFRQEYWNGLPFPSPGDLPNLGIEPESLASLAWQGGFFTAEPPRSPKGGSRRRSEGHEGEQGTGTSPGVRKFQGLDRVGRSVW